jgi:beta-glucosidase/6-phospho-beta-glucosidase/beta-galactosidase
MAQIDRRTPWLIPQPADGIGPVAEYYTIRYPSLPIFIIETGMPTDNGAPRPDGLTRSQQLLNAVDSIRRARQRGIPIIGTLDWSLTDNYERKFKFRPQLSRRIVAAHAKKGRPYAGAPSWSRLWVSGRCRRSG